MASSSSPRTRRAGKDTGAAALNHEKATTEGGKPGGQERDGHGRETAAAAQAQAENEAPRKEETQKAKKAKAEICRIWQLSAAQDALGEGLSPPGNWAEHFASRMWSLARHEPNVVQAKELVQDEVNKRLRSAMNRGPPYATQKDLQNVNEAHGYNIRTLYGSRKRREDSMESSSEETAVGQMHTHTQTPPQEPNSRKRPRPEPQLEAEDAREEGAGDNGTTDGDAHIEQSRSQAQEESPKPPRTVKTSPKGKPTDHIREPKRQETNADDNFDDLEQSLEQNIAKAELELAQARAQLAEHRLQATRKRAQSLENTLEGQYRLQRVLNDTKACLQDLVKLHPGIIDGDTSLSNGPYSITLNPEYVSINISPEADAVLKDLRRRRDEAQRADLEAKQAAEDCASKIEKLGRL